MHDIFQKNPGCAPMRCIFTLHSAQISIRVLQGMYFCITLEPIRKKSSECSAEMQFGKACMRQAIRRMMTDPDDSPVFLDILAKRSE